MAGLGKELRKSHRWGGALLVLLLTWGCSDGSNPTTLASPENSTSAGGNQGTGGPGSSKGKAPSIIVLAERESPEAVAHDHGIVPKHFYTKVLNGFAGDISEAAQSGLLRDNRVVRLEQDAEVTATSTEPAGSWGLDRIDQREPALDGLYQYERTGAGVTVYVIDTGIRYSHQEFEGRARFGFDAYGADGSDCYGHGTHVAGTIGGRTYGVAKSVSLVSVRVLNCSGFGTASGVLAGLEWIAQNHTGPSVINMSLVSSTKASYLDDAVQKLIDEGVTAVVAAGNSNDNVCDYSPARARDAITVGSSGTSDSRSAFSNYGSCIDLFAPGEKVVSAYSDSDTAVRMMSGTSMATPHAAGVAALYLDSVPSAIPAEVAATLGDWATKAIVGDAKSKNNDLLFSHAPITDSKPPASKNEAPTAGFDYTCETLTCDFTDTSADPDGSIVGWLWDFGTLIQATDQSRTITFPEPGTYLVSLVVTDEDGAQGSIAKPVTVTVPPANEAPSAWFTYECQELNCQFTDKSSDPDGVVVAWSWDFGPGAQAIGQDASFAFDSAGVFSVTLLVHDDEGAEGSTTREVAVSSSSANQAPSAWFTFECQELACRFKDQSSDPDGVVVAWSWDFGSGSEATGQDAAFAFAAPGVYPVTLVVRDDLGAEGSTTREVTVPSTAAGISLSATGYKLKGSHVVDLVWSGATGSEVSLFRDGEELAVVPNNGFFADNPGGKGKATYAYKVCEEDGEACSAEVTVVF